MKLKFILLFFANFFMDLNTNVASVIVSNYSDHAISCFYWTCPVRVSDTYSLFKKIPPTSWKCIGYSCSHEYVISGEFKYIYLFIQDGDIKIVKEFEYSLYALDYNFIYNKNREEVKELIEWGKLEINYQYNSPRNLK